MAAAGAVTLDPAPARRLGRACDWPHFSVNRASHPAATAGLRARQSAHRPPRFAERLDMGRGRPSPRCGGAS